LPFVVYLFDLCPSVCWFWLHKDKSWARTKIWPAISTNRTCLFIPDTISKHNQIREAGHRFNWDTYNLSAGVDVMLLHINGKFTWTLKSWNLKKKIATIHLDLIHTLNYTTNSWERNLIIKELISMFKWIFHSWSTSGMHDAAHANNRSYVTDGDKSWARTKIWPAISTNRTCLFIPDTISKHNQIREAGHRFKWDMYHLWIRTLFTIFICCVQLQF
jgi:hypothetical protein